MISRWKNSTSSRRVSEAGSGGSDPASSRRHLIEQLAAGLTEPSLEERRSALLDQFVEEVLPQEAMAQLAAHVQNCLDCRRLQVFVVLTPLYVHDIVIN
jgi:hypothetical protein